MSASKPLNIDEYISGFSEPTRTILQKIREVIAQAAPEAAECIKYAIPTFELHGNLVHFAAFKSHIGFYSMPTGQEAFKKELCGYRSGKGSAQFPLNEPIPYELIKRIVKYRVKENFSHARKLKKK